MVSKLVDYIALFSHRNSLAVLYLLLPFVIFCVGFLRWSIGLPMAIFSLYCTCRVVRSLPKEKDVLSCWQNVALAVVAFLWCVHSGIGGLWVQHADFFVKNAVLRDLMNRPWPMVYDLSMQSEAVQQLVGNDHVVFVYYLFTYLPAALCGWLFGSELVARIALLLWSAFGLFLVLNFILHRARGTSAKWFIFILVAFFCFSGLEVLGAPLLDVCLGNDVIAGQCARIQSLSVAKEMWCWPYFSMYGSLYSDMEIRFNQTIPIWVAMTLILSAKEKSLIGFFFAFLLLYSPWASLGVGAMIFYVVGRELLMSGWRGIKSYLSVESIVFPLLLAAIVGSYYVSNQNSASFSGWFWEYMPVSEFFVRYVIFILVEIGCYFLILRKSLAEAPWLQGSFVVLLFLPFYRMTAANDLLMCASIPAVFVIAVHWFDWLRSHFGQHRSTSCAIIALLCLTGLTPLEWLIAEDYHFISGRTERVKDSLYSFSTLAEDNAQLCDQQFFAHDYEDTFFWKYLAK